MTQNVYEERDAERVIILKSTDGGLTWVPDTTGGAAAGGAVTSVDGLTGAVVLSSSYQPLDSDLTAIAALASTPFGRSFLELVDAAAGRTLLALGTAATSATGDFDAAGAAAAAQAASQPLDADLTAIAALATTPFGRSVLEAANAAALRTLAGLVIGTDVQAYSANLAAIAGLTSAADSLPYFTGSGTAALATFTSAARTLLAASSAAAQIAVLGLDADISTFAIPANTTISTFGATLVDDADATTARSTLGLVIGTNVQAYDAELAAIAGLTSAADKLPYFTGSGTAALTDLTLQSRNFLANAGFAGAQADIGIYAPWDAVAVVSTDDTTTLTTMVVSSLTLPVLAFINYEFEVVLRIGTSAVTTGTRYSMGLDAGAGSICRAAYQGTSSGGAVAVNGGITAVNTATADTFLTFSNGIGHLTIKGLLLAGDADANFSVRHLKVTSGTATIFKGSTFKLRRTV